MKVTVEFEHGSKQELNELYRYFDKKLKKAVKELIETRDWSCEYGKMSTSVVYCGNTGSLRFNNVAIG